MAAKLQSIRRFARAKIPLLRDGADTYRILKAYDNSDQLQGP